MHVYRARRRRRGENRPLVNAHVTCTTRQVVRPRFEFLCTGCTAAAEVEKASGSKSPSFFDRLLAVQFVAAVMATQTRYLLPFSFLFLYLSFRSQRHWYARGHVICCTSCVCDDFYCYYQNMNYNLFKNKYYY
jgi:hypothetical protein